MKKSQLIKIIKEEISNTLKEAPLFKPTENPLSPGELSMGSIPKVQASAPSRFNFPGTFTVSVAGKPVGMSFEQLKTFDQNLSDTSIKRRLFPRQSIENYAKEILEQHYFFSWKL